jgi:hypothetical protein
MDDAAALHRLGAMFFLLSDIVDDRKAGQCLGLQRVVAEWMLF